MTLIALASRDDQVVIKEIKSHVYVIARR
jgi:hypothetical protein